MSETFSALWAQYRATKKFAEALRREGDDEWATRLHASLVAEWHDVDDCPSTLGTRSGPHPILWYDQKRYPGYPPAYSARTEACIFCGVSHLHGADSEGNGDGHRVPHCGRHTHDLTPTGRRRNFWGRGVVVCPGCNDSGDYMLKRRPS